MWSASWAIVIGWKQALGELQVGSHSLISAHLLRSQFDSERRKTNLALFKGPVSRLLASRRSKCKLLASKLLLKTGPVELLLKMAVTFKKLSAPFAYLARFSANSQMDPLETGNSDCERLAASVWKNACTKSCGSHLSVHCYQRILSYPVVSSTLAIVALPDGKAGE